MKTILVTGANGEIGHGLINRLAQDNTTILALDLHPLSSDIAAKVDVSITGDITSKEVLQQLEQHNIDVVFHLAALLSTSAEKNPLLAHNVNVNGTMGLLEVSRTIAERNHNTVVFVFPSSIAVYGLTSIPEKFQAPCVPEHRFLNPITMYGVNKLYCEQVGTYYSTNFNSLAESKPEGRVDFRSLRFPGLISAHTVPTGGTSDFIPEMLHAAASGSTYSCFVRPDTQIPFMVMPDAIDSLIQLSEAEESRLRQRVYNVTSFAPTAGEFAEVLNTHYPAAVVKYSVNEARQRIVDSWPANIDDSAARRDWDWKPQFGLKSALIDYLIPQVSQRYSSESV